MSANTNHLHTQYLTHIHTHTCATHTYIPAPHTTLYTCASSTPPRLTPVLAVIVSLNSLEVMGAGDWQGRRSVPSIGTHILFPSG